MCKQNCEILPKDFEDNIAKLFFDAYSDGSGKLARVKNDLENIIHNVKLILPNGIKT